MGKLSPFERLLCTCTRVQAGEGRCVALLCLQAFALMCAYYLIRPVREALILTEGGAELRNYAVGVQAALLIVLVPVYGALVRRIDSRRVFRCVCFFFAGNLVVLAVIGQTGVRLGFPFFVWASIFNVMVVTQFWAFATDLFNVRAGHRLFGVVAVGVSAGAWIGSRAATASFEALGPYGLMLASAVMLVTAAFVSRWSRKAVPPAARSMEEAPAEAPGSRLTARLGGFALIARSRYLIGIAALVVLLNWVTTAGEFVLSDWLVEAARREAPGAEQAFIGQFMGHYCASITLAGFLIQLLLVSRIILVAGIVRALMITPLVFFAGYLAIGIVPVFALLQPVLILQRSLDYSLLNTTRSALLLPTSREVKYQAKTAIDTFFYRAGDLLASLSIYAGLALFGEPRMQVVYLIVVLTAVMTLVAWLIGREYTRRYGSACNAPISQGSGGMVPQQ